MSFCQFFLEKYILLLLNTTAQEVDSSSLYTSMRELTLSAYFSLFLFRSFTLLLSSSCRFSSCRKRTARKTTKSSNQSRAIHSFINSFRLHICMYYHKRSGNSHFFSSSSSSSSKLTTSLGFRVSGLKFSPDITIL